MDVLKVTTLDGVVVDEALTVPVPLNRVPRPALMAANSSGVTRMTRRIGVVFLTTVLLPMIG